MADWASNAVKFFESIADPILGGSRSIPGGGITLYGTCYTALAKDYILGNEELSKQTREFLIRQQDPESGLLIGPELKDYYPEPRSIHDREHLILHSTCAALPTFQHFGLQLKHEVRAAHRFCDLDFLRSWLKRRNLKNAWLEGNNILFVGQLLVYLRDVEANRKAQPALDLWFQWLDDNVDPGTGLWGTNGYCSAAEAVYGGYHQLLVYYHEHHPLTNPRGLVDIVLSLQHHDGGFSPHANAGACEDADGVDILVNLYKRADYRHAEIRHALTRCAGHILATQNDDGGFPYNRDRVQSHMGIPATHALPNISTAFATWFRIHTLALCAEIIPEHPAFSGRKFHFSRPLSMGWHRSPRSWKLDVTLEQLRRERLLHLQSECLQYFLSGRRLGGKILSRLRLR